MYGTISSIFTRFVLTWWMISCPASGIFPLLFFLFGQKLCENIGWEYEMTIPGFVKWTSLLHWKESLTLCKFVINDSDLLEEWSTVT